MKIGRSSRGTADFFACDLQVLKVYRLRRANAGACAALDALVRVDYIDITSRDGLDRALVDACSASNARV